MHNNQEYFPRSTSTLILTLAADLVLQVVSVAVLPLVLPGIRRISGEEAALELE